jgi:hypothetical protein
LHEALVIAPVLHQVPFQWVITLQRRTQENAEPAGLVHVLAQCRFEALRLRETIFYQLANGLEIGFELVVIQELLDAGTHQDLPGKVEVHRCPFPRLSLQLPLPKKGTSAAHDSRFTPSETPQGAPSRALPLGLEALFTHLPTTAKNPVYLTRPSRKHASGTLILANRH